LSEWINRAAAFLWGEAAAQAERWPLWTPVAFGAGAASYFGLKSEPPLWLGATLAGVAWMLTLAAHRWGRSRLEVLTITLAAFAATGFANGSLATWLADASRIPAGYGVGQVEGWVVDVSSPSADRGRMLIAPTRISHLDDDRLPARVRVVVKPQDLVGPGEAVRLTALLDPPPRPAAPGAFDFARDAFFERIGGVGLAMKPPVIITLPDPPGRLRAEMALNRMRWRVARSLVDDIARFAPGAGEGARGLAAAVTTSHEAWLPPEEADGLRGSGLAHMLAIAGLHTAAVCGFVFAALRIGVAAWPWLAVRVSSKKVAAAGALIAVLCYLALSGAHPPAKRAAITAGVAFVAILLDRRAISLRSLAIAALLVLALQPEAVVQPGFQMSFCATGALVAMAEIWPHRAPRIDAPWPIRFLQKARDWTVALFMVSFVAGAATGPFAIQHFNRMANYGVFANLTADFVASAIMMPALAVSLPFEALGLGRDGLAAPLTVAGWAARAILEIGRFCTDAPGGQVTMPSAPAIAMLVAFLGILFGMLWKGRLRWIGAPLAFAVILWPRPAPPIAWIANDGNGAAVVKDGTMIVMKPGLRPYATDLWSARRGFKHAADDTAARDALFDCDRKGCAPKPGTFPAIGTWWSTRPPPAGRIEALCQVSQVISVRAEIERPPDCAGKLFLMPADFAAKGAAELFADHGKLRVSYAEPIRGRRPWSGAAEEVSDSDE
jgi:competence protein ComEC